MTILKPAKFLLNQIRRIGRTIASIIEYPVLVLTYHRVCDLQNDPQQLAVSPENFEKQMEFLKNNYEIVDYKDDWFPRKNIGVVITFDDGYADNLENAIPILERNKVPATFFISTSLLDTENEFWWDQLERLILDSKHSEVRFNISDIKTGCDWSTKTEASKKILYKDIQPLIKDMDLIAQMKILERLTVWAGIGAKNRNTHRVLSIEELQELNRSKYATVGGHTTNHLKLSVLDRAGQYKEILNNTTYLERILGEKIVCFSYPFGGRRDFTADTLSICNELKFKKVAANYPGHAHSWTHRYKIPRFVVRNWTATQYDKKIMGFITQ